MSKIQTKKVDFFMIPVPKFILNNYLRGALFLNFKEFLLDTALEEISTQNGPFNFDSNSMSSCVSQ